jgi:hypothetical protein
LKQPDKTWAKFSTVGVSMHICHSAHLVTTMFVER